MEKLKTNLGKFEEQSDLRGNYSTFVQIDDIPGLLLLLIGWMLQCPAVFKN